MNRDNEERAGIEGLLKRVRPPEPSSELKTRVLRTAGEAWLKVSTGVPWHIPIRRLAISAVAATVLISLANLYGDRVSAHRLPAPTPIAERVDPYDFDVMMDPDASSIRYTVTTARSAQPDASALVDHLERVREALGETKRDDASDSPAPAERRSRLPQIPSSLNS
jgi:hypothetical protein